MTAPLYRGSTRLTRFYLVVFVGYMLGPVALMSASAFNASRFPTIIPWLGFTTAWFGKLFADGRSAEAAITSLVVAIAVVSVSVPTGTAAALVISSLSGRARGFVYGVMLAPMLLPGIIVGISTLIFWNALGIKPGVALIILAQSSFIISLVMIVVLARLERLDPAYEEAALDLGSSHWHIARRVLLPFLAPALVAAAVLAFFQSLEVYTATLFVKGMNTTLTVMIASKVRSGIDPTVSALAFCLIGLTIGVGVAHEALRRRDVRLGRNADDRAAAGQPAPELSVSDSTSAFVRSRLEPVSFDA